MNNIWLKDPLTKGSISKIYNTLVQIDCTATLHHIKNAWSEDLGVNITEEQWTEAQERVHSSSICIRHGLLQFKILHQLHLSKERLSKIFPGADAFLVMLLPHCRIHFGIVLILICTGLQ